MLFSLSGLTGTVQLRCGPSFLLYLNQLFKGYVGPLQACRDETSNCDSSEKLVKQQLTCCWSESLPLPLASFSSEAVLVCELDVSSSTGSETRMNSQKYSYVQELDLWVPVCSERQASSSAVSIYK